MSALSDAQQQAWLNQQTAIDEKLIGDTNTVTPGGSQTFTGTPGQDYTETQSLNPTRLEAFNMNDQTRLLGATQGYGRLWDFNRQYGPMDPGDYGPMGSVLRSDDLPNAWGFDPGHIGQVERATFDRGMGMLAPLLRDDRAKLDSTLANQGIAGETVAAGRARSGQGRQQGEMLRQLAMDSVLAGRGEHSRLAGLGMAHRAQEADLQGQSFGQAEGQRRSNLDMERLIRSQLMNELLSHFNLGNFEQGGYQPSVQPNVSGVDYMGANMQNSEANKGFISSLLGSILGFAGTR